MFFDNLIYINYFEYDLAGNRTHLHYVDTSVDEWTYYTYNIENQLTIEETGGSATYYEYDAAGALLRKDVAGTISYYEYNYDGLMNRFDDGNTVATYTFDTDSRRIEKDVDGTVSKFAYSDADVVAEYDGDDVLQATYNTPSIDQNLTVKIGEAVYHYFHDGLGSVRNLIDSDETIQNTYDYLAFGSVYGTPTENVSNSFRFTSRRWDSESSLYYFRMRMYCRLLGRFLSKDPILSSNLYYYVGNNPLSFTDPNGKATFDSLKIPAPHRNPLAPGCEEAFRMDMIECLSQYYTDYDEDKARNCFDKAEKAYLNCVKDFFKNTAYPAELCLQKAPYPFPEEKKIGEEPCRKIDISRDTIIKCLQELIGEPQSNIGEMSVMITICQYCAMAPIPGNVNCWACGAYIGGKLVMFLDCLAGHPLQNALDKTLQELERHAGKILEKAECICEGASEPFGEEGSKNVARKIYSASPCSQGYWWWSQFGY